LILLVWNIPATVGHLASNPIPPGPTKSDFPAAGDGNPGPGTNLSAAQSPRSGPLTIRQKYLLGKRVDINKASIEEISELPGISDRVAAAVVEERKRIGGFRTAEDLLGVKGIKEKRLRKILPFLAELPNN
jgi:competence protein ComEA